MTIATKGIQTTLYTRQIATIMQTSAILTIQHIIQLKFEQESSDFSQERNALFLFLYQLLSVLVPDVLLYNLFAHIPQSTHVVTVAP